MRLTPRYQFEYAPPIPAFARRGGFTFLEILVVLLIMGILTAIVIPRYSEATNDYRVSLAAERIAADLRLAREHAMTSGVSQVVQFNVNTNSYSIPGLPDMNHPDKAHTVVLSQPPHQCTLTSADFGGSADITFDLYGTPTSSGTVVVGSGTMVRSVEVESGSGKVTLP